MSQPNGQSVGGDPPLLEVSSLQIAFAAEQGVLVAVDDATFSVRRGETVGVVGESGSGKTVTGLALLDLIPSPGRRVGGTIRWCGTPHTPQELRQLRGRRIAMIQQDPMTSLSPLMTVGRQIVEVIERHLELGRRAARARALELLELVGVPAPRDRFDQLPHQFSGGMRQRVLIAAALASEPDLLIADEPTTALDVTVQAQILELLASIQQEFGLAVLLISHDLGVVRMVSDRVMVMYAGRTVEFGQSDAVLTSPRHPYTQGLLASTPRGSHRGGRLPAIGGAPPKLGQYPSGCRFHPRCPQRIDRCDSDVPELRSRDPEPRIDACHLEESGAPS